MRATLPIQSWDAMKVGWKHLAQNRAIAHRNWVTLAIMRVVGTPNGFKSPTSTSKVIKTTIPNNRATLTLVLCPKLMQNQNFASIPTSNLR